ncbi:MAG: 16S rRNA (cytosine(1402)-N(4))-methyltransferase RsmH [Anaerolineae bacterium]|nr:MAG: 16S rRNA (cytosine(1402)-N(4))-methyltransferase RsmH [Anaerolineae bacterium]
MVRHTPVLFQEIIEFLKPSADGLFIDGTIGAGGHAAGILEASNPSGRLLGFDRDPEAVVYSEKRLVEFGNRIVLVKASFAEMGVIAPPLGFDRVDGIVLDLGLSSRQLADGRRGFSFRSNGPLDMRFNPDEGLRASDLLNEMSEDEMTMMFRKYGEVRRSNQLARAIIAERPINSTSELVQIIEKNIKRSKRIHPATQVFQALRIAVNDELGELERGLQAAVQLLKNGGRLSVISFHSLEDRLVKNYFRDQSRDCICPTDQPICTCDHKAQLILVTRKIVRPSENEIAKNPRSRSARLRVAEKTRGEA